MTTNSLFGSYTAPEIAKVKVELCKGFALSGDNKNDLIDIFYGGTDNEFGW